MRLDQRCYEEKRDFIRIPVDCEVALHASDPDRHFSGAGKNLSASGVLFITRERLAPGERLEMHIESDPAMPSRLDATIEVIRVEPGPDGSGYRVGSAIVQLHNH